MGLCPFHNEKSPSFGVNEKRGFFHCFGCGAHGDIISFVEKTENKSFIEAVTALAEMANLSLPTRMTQLTPRETERKSLYGVLEKACLWFEDNLQKTCGERAREYLLQRGLTREEIRTFRIGWAPRNGLIAHLKSLGISMGHLKEVGLILCGEGSAPCDWFRNRITFPIFDARNRVIAFGARTIEDAKPKYLNSPETILFEKGRELYGLVGTSQMKNAPWLIAEGYLDVIALRRFGPAVSPLGTSLSEEQLSFIWRFCSDPILCFDGDDAGRNASLRAAERALPLLTPDKMLRFRLLPSGEDPHSLVHQRRWRHDEAPMMLSTFLWTALQAQYPLRTPEQQALRAQQVEAWTNAIRHPLVRQSYKGFFWSCLHKRKELPPTLFRRVVGQYAINNEILIGILLFEPHLLVETQELLSDLPLDSRWEFLRCALISWVEHRGGESEGKSREELRQKLREALLENGIQMDTVEPLLRKHAPFLREEATLEELRTRWMTLFNAVRVHEKGQKEIAQRKLDLLRDHTDATWEQLKAMKEACTERDCDQEFLASLSTMTGTTTRNE